MRTRLLLTALTLIAAVALPGCTSGGDDEASAKNSGHANADIDVQLVKCGWDKSGRFPQAELAIENHSSKRSSYLIQVEFLNGSGRRTSESTAALDDLAPGRQAKTKAIGPSKAPDDFSCNVGKVTRQVS
ncbi:hypothetical protein [Streptomyces sp. S.PB5]|uniref:hypothetical protein n=1 Tax=Streptomyces sp. S.PB5 TaxID=3020844 RepID=UPI0025B0D305|nr:hypothetical protein [Streptomyces sp. S.PB5]MDN3026043.1 hypothetical protein [Streptomyces sp. S.PB5]